MKFSRLTSFVDHLEDIYGIPYCDISIYQEHEEIFRRSSGYTDLERTKRPDDQDLYWLYSVSKVSLTVMILQLVEQGELRLDDPVCKYIPEAGRLQIRTETGLKPCAHQATIEDYLAMQGGLKYNVERSDILSYTRENPAASTRDVIHRWLTIPLDFEPGTRFQYSMCHDVLGAVIEVVTGRRLQDHIQEAIAKPLGMQDLDYGIRPEKKDRMVQQYEYDPLQNFTSVRKKKLYPISSFQNHFILGENYDCAGAGLVTRVSDYILLADALANDGIGWNGTRILTRESIDNMRRSRLDTPQKKTDYRKGMDFGYEYGLGVRTLVYPETSKSPVGEFGWDGYAGVFLLADVENRLSMLFAMSVGNMSPAKQVHHRMRDLMYEGLKTK
ncbi:MAG: serine hydrolase [Eubacterium sp.]|nr:serine hydrolase [Eubacterium sp.]